MPFHVELSHASSGRRWDVEVSEACSFGQLKGAAAELIGVPPEGFQLIFRGRPRSDDDFLVDAGVGQGSKIAAAETAEFRRTRGADAALAREQAAAADLASHPLSPPSPPEERRNPPPAPPPASSSASSSDPIGRQLDALEASIAALEGEAAAAGLFVAGPSAASSPSVAADVATAAPRAGLFSRRQAPLPPPPASTSSSSHDRAALFKEALRLSELSTQQLIQLDAVELPHVAPSSSGEGEEGGGDANGNGASASSSSSTAAALAWERVSALRLRRKSLIKRAQALGDAMDRAKERLK